VVRSRPSRPSLVHSVTVEIPSQARLAELRRSGSVCRSLTTNDTTAELLQEVLDGNPPRFLVVTVTLVCPTSGTSRSLKALVDTGATVNIVREGLFPVGSFSPPPQRKFLKTADGSVLRGGDSGAEFDLSMPVLGWTGAHETKQSRGYFYSGNIHVDVILGYGFLAQCQLIVVPHKDTIMPFPSFQVLRDLFADKTSCDATAGAPFRRSPHC
jgi:hypothetical protein